MASRKYTTARPMQEVRLKSWPAGKVAQFKRAIELLEGELNDTMASQIAQGAKRVISARVPKVTGLTLKAGFKNFTIAFSPAKGITDLLFYEIQKDSTSSFASPTTYTVPQTSLTIPTTEEREQIYVRVRCMNSKFEVGPWSTSVGATGSSNFRITVTRQAAYTVNIPAADFIDEDINGVRTWIDVGGLTYVPTTASMCLHIHAGIHSYVTQDESSHTPEVVVSNSISSARFRLLRNGVELTNAGTMECSASSNYDNRFGEGNDQYSRTENAVVSTLVTPFETYTGQESAVEYTLQISGGTSTINASDGVNVIVDCFDLMELVQSG